MPDSMNMDGGDVLNLGPPVISRSFQRRRKKGKGDSCRQILISAHREGKGQSEAHNRMCHFLVSHLRRD